MDITRDLKRRKRKSECGLLMPVPGKPVQNSLDEENKIMLENGEIIEIPDDIKSLPEFDWDDPKTQEWVNEEEKQHIKKYGKLTTEQMTQIYKTKCQFLNDDPSLDPKKAFDLAWEKTLQKKLSQHIARENLRKLR